MKPPGDKEIDDTSVYIRTSLTLTPQISKMGWGPTAQDLPQTDKTKSTLWGAFCCNFRKQVVDHKGLPLIP